MRGARRSSDLGGHGGEPMQPTSDQIAIFRRLFLRHEPVYQAWMQPPGAPAKYFKKFHAISAVEIAAHLAGGVTLAAPLIGPDERAQAAALDIDAGGGEALHRGLTPARRRNPTP